MVEVRYLLISQSCARDTDRHQHTRIGLIVLLLGPIAQRQLLIWWSWCQGLCGRIADLWSMCAFEMVFVAGPSMIANVSVCVAFFVGHGRVQI